MRTRRALLHSMRRRRAQGQVIVHVLAQQCVMLSSSRQQLLRQPATVCAKICENAVLTSSSTRNRIKPVTVIAAHIAYAQVVSTKVLQGRQHQIALALLAPRVTLVTAAQRALRAKPAAQRRLAQELAATVAPGTGRQHEADRARRVRAVHSRPLAVMLARHGARARRAEVRRQRAHPRRIAHASRVWQARRGLVATMALLARQ